MHLYSNSSSLVSIIGLAILTRRGYQGYGARIYADNLAESNNRLTAIGVQKPLGVAVAAPVQPLPLTVIPNSNGLKKHFTHNFVYFTDISIGTPPQTFQVLLDISSPETFVSSSRCKTCYPGDVKYDAAQSRSYKSNGTALDFEYAYLSAQGNVSIDTFRVGGIQIQNQPFLEATTVMPIGASWDDLSVIHGVLGLTPSSAGSTLHNPSPFTSMAAQGALDRNVFSMRLREPRELLFGSVNHEMYTGDLIHLPLTSKSGKYVLTGRWQAEAGYLTVGDQPGIRQNLDGYTASFSTTSPYMLLPDPLVLYVLEILQFEDVMFMPPSVDCEKRRIMPSITINLAGHNFTLSPYDYTFEWPVEGSKTRCASAIMPFGVEQYEEIVLGSAFLRTFYSVFDLDNRTIGFAPLSS